MVFMFKKLKENDLRSELASHRGEVTLSAVTVMKGKGSPESKKINRSHRG